MGRTRATGALAAALASACSNGVADDGGFGSATIASSATQGEAGSQSEGNGSSEGGSGSQSSDPSNSGNSTDPSDTNDPSGPTEGSEGDPPGGEVCNGLDDDGDGSVDEDIPEIACGEGICAVSVPGCEGGVASQCFPGAAGTESCNGLDDDCDGTSDEELTQSCDSACGAGTQSCAGGAWGECDAPPPQAESCDVDDDDCNGAVDDGVAGCRIDIHRWWHPVTGEHFYSTDVNEGNCCGFNLEVAGFYELYAGAHAGLTAFYRCYGANGFHHYTTDSNCEGLPGNEGIMGYIGTSELPGSTELYRSYNAANGDHFFTNSSAEHDYAVDTLGFVDEGVVGWVW